MKKKEQRPEAQVPYRLPATLSMAVLTNRPMFVGVYAKECKGIIPQEHHGDVLRLLEDVMKENEVLTGRVKRYRHTLESGRDSLGDMKKALDEAWMAIHDGLNG